MADGRHHLVPQWIVAAALLSGLASADLTSAAEHDGSGRGLVLRVDDKPAADVPDRTYDGRSYGRPYDARRVGDPRDFGHRRRSGDPRGTPEEVEERRGLGSRLGPAPTGSRAP